MLNIDKISTKYTATATKVDGTDTLSASEWNNISSAVATSHNKINDIIDAAGTGGSSALNVADETVSGGDATVGVSIVSGNQTIGSPKVIELTKKKKGVNTTLTSGNNINIEPRESVNESKGGNISLKPGDDIELCSHHRLSDNQNEVSVKVINGNDEPVKLQVNLESLTLTTKDSVADSPNVLDVNVNSAKNTKGYLKVRAQAIDLRCEDHGGIALQPKGSDGQGHMNKIKFEHGGGDGLEFGTFNAEKTSIFTDEYRFNKDGVWKMATRTKEASDKADVSDATTAYKYVKQADDFYDVISVSDSTATTKDIIQVAGALNREADGISTFVDQNGNTEIFIQDGYLVEFIDEYEGENHSLFYDNVEAAVQQQESLNQPGDYDEYSISDGTTTHTVYAIFGILDPSDYNKVFSISELITKWSAFDSIESFGGENHGSSDYVVFTTSATDITIVKFTRLHRDIKFTSGSSSVNTSVSFADVVKLVNYMKTNNQGPWAL